MPDAPAPTALDWKPGGSEVMVWTNLGPKWWASVWPNSEDGFTGWVSGPVPPFRHLASHETQEAACSWCEKLMREGVHAAL